VLRWNPKLNLSGIYPPTVPCVPAPLSLHGVPRVGSPASQVQCSAPTSLRPAQVAPVFPRGPVPVADCSISLLGAAQPESGPSARSFLCGGPTRDVNGRPRDLGEISQVPGEPLATCPALRPRRGELASIVLLAAPVAFRGSDSVGPRSLSDFGAPSRGPLPRCLRFAGRVAPYPRKTRYRLARTGLAGQDFHPLARWVPKRVSRGHRLHLRSLAPSFSWRTITPDMRL